MIEIRTALPDDDAALVAIDHATHSPENSPAPSPPAGRVFFERTPPENVLVAVADGVVVGFTMITNTIPLASHDHVLEIRGLAVAPQAGGQGVGARLVTAAVEMAAARGARKISLRVLGHNARARRLYERCGFAVEGVLRDEFLLEGRYVDDVLMARSLV